jgi:hypothetical protein
MVLLFRLLSALGQVGRGIGAAANGLANLITAVSLALYMHATEADMQALRNWLRGTPQEQQQTLKEQPSLTPEEQALLAEFLRIMDTQYQVGVLQRYVLTLPALSDEGY